VSDLGRLLTLGYLNFVNLTFHQPIQKT